MNKKSLPEPTLDDHPGLDNDEATEAGKMMTASGSVGPKPDADAEHPERATAESHGDSGK